MRDIDKATERNQLPSISSIHKFKKDELIQTLKKYGLKSDVTVIEGRKLLNKLISSSQKSQVNEPVFEMDETDSICFVCDKKISSENWKYKLLETASKKRNVPVADLIKQLVGSEFAVLVGERDVVCSSCMTLLNLMDTLTAQLKTVQSTLSKHLYSKYNLESESTKFQVEYDNSVAEPTEPLHKCSTCNFESKYEKEYNMHIRTHKSEKPAISSKPTSPKTPNLKLVKNKKKIKSSPYKKTSPSPSKKTPPSMLRMTTRKTKPTKPKSISKQKKTKIVFQCSVCNKMFPNEASIRSHAKKDHGNENIVVSDESEYEDIQTLESSDEESSVHTKKTSSKQIKTKPKPSLDFLEDWNEDEEDLKFAKHSNTSELTSVKTSLSKAEDISHNDGFNEDEDDEEEEEQDQSSKPTCLFCNAKFLSFESVQDHVKMNHRDRASHLNLTLKSPPPLESSEIDSTTDIVENKNPIKVGRKSSVSKIKSFKCNICGIKKVSLKFIKKHIQAHKRKIALQCKLCGTSFRTIVAINVHRYRCHKVVGVKRKCSQCKILFIDSNQLKAHIKKVHSKQKVQKKKKQKAVQLEPTSGYSLRKSVDSSKLPRNLQRSNIKKVDSKISQLTHDNSKISSSEVSSTSLENGLQSSTRQKYICSLCNFVSNSDLEMKGHMKKHNIEENVSTGKILTVGLSKKKVKDSSKLKCNECDIYVSQPRQLVNHMNRHKANTCNDLGLCFYCNRLFLEKEQLIIHLNTAHNFKTNPKCTICGKIYAHSKDLKLHFLRTHFSTKTENLIKQVSEQFLNKTTSKNSEANDVYSKVFKELQDLTGEGNEEVSMDLAVSSLQYNCPLCDFSDCNKNVVEKHLSSHPQNYCNICKTLFNTEEAIKHLENHSIDFQNKTCPDCEDTFHDSIHLQSHTLRIHSGGKKLCKCSMCEKSFFSEKGLLSHKQTMHGKTSKKVLSCKKCNMNFYTEKEFGTHVEFAHRVVLNCKYCDKTLNNVKKLVQHEKNHLKQVKKIYKCNICGKVLKTLSALKSHKSVHNRNIPLQCETCTQTFKSFHALREHSAKHSDNQEKRFFCSVCDKGFYFYDSHYRHRRIHLDPLLFKCNACGERFQSKLKRLEHKNICSVSTQCPKCLKFFDTNVALKKHECLQKK